MKITVTLNPAQEAYFNEVMYSLDLPHKRPSHSDIINHCLGELAAFELVRDDQVTNFLDTENHELYQKFLADNKDDLNSNLDRRVIKKMAGSFKEDIASIQKHHEEQAKKDNATPKF